MMVCIAGDVKMQYSAVMLQCSCEILLYGEVQCDGGVNEWFCDSSVVVRYCFVSGDMMV